MGYDGPDALAKAVGFSYHSAAKWYREKRPTEMGALKLIHVLLVTGKEKAFAAQIKKWRTELADSVPWLSDDLAADEGKRGA